jgi:hypothetical protein
LEQTLNSRARSEKQAAPYSGTKKAHSDKNVVVASLEGEDVDFLSWTYVGKTHDKTIADQEDISYPPGATWYKDTGFQGYEPAVAEIGQAKKESRAAASSRRLRSAPTGSWPAFGSGSSMPSRA